MALHLRPFVSLVAIATLTLCFASGLAAQELPKGAGPWKELFDGKTLEGWTQYGGKAPIVAKDGEIVGSFVPDKFNSFLATKKEYSDFVFEVQIKIEGGNSGVQFRSHVRPQDGIERVFGYQSEFDPGDPRKICGIYEEAARGWINDLRHTETGVKVAAVYKKDDWNTVRIQAVGDHIQTWLNGFLVTDFKDAMQKSGFIALQVHEVKTDEGKTVRFKNPRIREVSR